MSGDERRGNTETAEEDGVPPALNTASQALGKHECYELA